MARVGGYAMTVKKNFNTWDFRISKDNLVTSLSHHQNSPEIQFVQSQKQLFEDNYEGREFDLY